MKILAENYVIHLTDEELNILSSCVADKVCHLALNYSNFDTFLEENKLLMSIRKQLFEVVVLETELREVMWVSFIENLKLTLNTDDDNDDEITDHDLLMFSEVSPLDAKTTKLFIGNCLNPKLKREYPYFIINNKEELLETIKTNGFKAVLCHVFEWAKTPQKNKFWEDIYHSL